jgi:hypothetical protein
VYDRLSASMADAADGTGRVPNNDAEEVPVIGRETSGG